MAQRPMRGDTPPPDGLKWIAVDLDNTLSDSRIDLETGNNPLGNPINGSLNKCLELVQHGYKIVIHTSRPWYEYEMIENWLLSWGFPFSAIVCGKLQARAYVDDRNIDHRSATWLPEQSMPPGGVEKFYHLFVDADSFDNDPYETIRLVTRRLHDMIPRTGEYGAPWER